MKRLNVATDEGKAQRRFSGGILDDLHDEWGTNTVGASFPILLLPYQPETHRAHAQPCSEGRWVRPVGSLSALLPNCSQSKGR